MKFIIKHEIRGRIRIHLIQDRMSYKEADILQYYLERLEEVTHAKVYEKTADAAIRFTGDRTAVIRALKAFHYSVRIIPEKQYLCTRKVRTWNHFSKPIKDRKSVV